MQSSSLWSWLMFIGSYIYICTAALDAGDYGTKIGIELPLLVLFWADTVM